MGELRWGERVITTPVKTNTPSSILPRHEGELDVLRALLRLACQVEHNFSLNTNRDLFAGSKAKLKQGFGKALLPCCYRNRILSSLRMSHKSRFKRVLNLFLMTGDSPGER